MILSIDNLSEGMSVIYKINYNDGHFYIGYTDNLKRRINEHIRNGKQPKTYHKYIQACDRAIFEQGGLTTIEILEFCPIALLPEREKYWIAFYDAYKSDLGYNKTPGSDGSNQSGEFNARACLTNNQVYDIRKRKFLGERKKDVYKDYNFMSFSGFEKVWLGHGYSGIGQDFISATKKTRQQSSHDANIGTKNGRAKLSHDDVISIRRRFKSGESISSIQKIYSFVSINTIRRVVNYESYKDVK